jgi:hypothetical protein
MICKRERKRDKKYKYIAYMCHIEYVYLFIYHLHCDSLNMKEDTLNILDMLFYIFEETEKELDSVEQTLKQ